MFKLWDIKINYFNSLKKINKHKNFAYYLQTVGLTWFPVDGENKAVIFKIEDNFFQYIPYDYRNPTTLPLKLNFSENKLSNRKYSIRREIKRTLKYVYRYSRRNKIEELVYSKGHPLTILTPIMISTGDDIELIKLVLNNNITPYTLAKLTYLGLPRETIVEAVTSLSENMINKIYM